MVDEVIGKNGDVNGKFDTECLLIDKQGLLFVGDAQAARGQFERHVAMQAIALGYARMLDAYGYRRAKAPEFFDFALAKIRPWITQSGDIFDRSVSNRDAWNLLLAEFGLPGKLDGVMASGPVEKRLSAGGEVFDRLTHGWWENPGFGATLCHEMSAAADLLDLEFIRDSEMRADVLADFHEAVAALRAHAYKSAVVLAGASAETLLRERCSGHIPNPHDPWPKPMRGCQCSPTLRARRAW